MLIKQIKQSIYKLYEKDGIDLSGGEEQKIAIARALYKDAPFVILDEPTAALDPIAKARFIHALMKLQETKQLSIFLTDFHPAVSVVVLLFLTTVQLFRKEHMKNSSKIPTVNTVNCGTLRHSITRGK